MQVAKFNSTDEMHVYLIRALLANLLDSQLTALLLFSTCSCRYCSDYVNLLPGFLSVVLLRGVPVVVMVMVLAVVVAVVVVIVMMLPVVPFCEHVRSDFVGLVSSVIRK